VSAAGADIATAMMKLERRYDLDESDALARAHALTDYWSKKHGVKVDWRGDNEVHLAGRVMGVKFDGTVHIGAGVIRAEMNAGFLAEKLGARAYVERKLDDYLDRTKSVEELRARIPR
jgi:hypothetical protein